MAALMMRVHPSIRESGGGREACLRSTSLSLKSRLKPRQSETMHLYLYTADCHPMEAAERLPQILMDLEHNRISKRRTSIAAVCMPKTGRVQILDRVGSPVLRCYTTSESGQCAIGPPYRGRRHNTRVHLRWPRRDKSGRCHASLNDQPRLSNSERLPPQNRRFVLQPVLVSN